MIVSIDKNPFKKLKSGLHKITEIVQETLGPSGKNILIDRGNTPPLSTRDGVTVAKHIYLKDPLENFTALAVKEASLQTNAIAGDGTSTAAVLTKAIFDEGQKRLKKGWFRRGINAIDLKRSLDEAVEKAIRELKKVTTKIRTQEQIANVATISANNDETLGKIIAKAVYRVGHKGSVLVENSPTPETYLRFQDGMTIERGFGETSVLFADPNRRFAIQEDPLIAIIAETITTMTPLMPILKHAITQNRNLLLFVKDIDEGVLNFLIRNKLQKGLKCVVLRLPGIDDIEAVEDLALRVNTTVYHPDLFPLNPATFNPDDLGTCEKAVISFHDTTIVKGSGDIQDRIQSIKNQISDEEDEITKARLQDRLNRLTNSIAIIMVAAETETERQDIHFRIEDAINAAKAAASEGIVEGGGITLHRIKDKLGNTVGEKILKKAFSAPIKAIIENTGENPKKILKVMNKLGNNCGYNAKTKAICNLKKAGVIDPAKVVRTALQKAASVAGLLLTTGSCIINEKENK